MVRIGANGDGGYVIDMPIESIPYVISLGIDQEISFDWEFAERGINVFQYDPSIDQPPRQHNCFLFRKLAVSHITGLNSISLNDVILEAGESSVNGILKFDIEGHEWLALASASSELLSGFQTLVGEFHFFDAIENRQYFDLFSYVLEKLSFTHTLTHLHPNNGTGVVVVNGVVFPRLMELTFRRNDLGTFLPEIGLTRSCLDYPSVMTLPELLLPSFWNY